MLVLTRKTGEAVRIGDNVVITISAIQGNRVRIGIQAPKDIPIVREELRKERHPQETVQRSRSVA